jgi:hemerythrin
MSIAEWQQEYNTGHAVIDRQHQQLFSMVNQLHDVLSHADMSKDYVHAMLTDFAAAAVEHFDTEEVLMGQYNYPNTEVHKGTHRLLVSKVRTTLQKFEQDETDISAEIAQVLADWMIHHIRGEDQNMIRFFQAQPETTGDEVLTRQVVAEARV